MSVQGTPTLSGGAWLEGANGELFLYVYNDTAGELTDGKLVLVEYFNDADSCSPAAYPTLATPATSSVAIHKIGVVANGGAPGSDGNAATGQSASIPDQAWGWVQVRGYCNKINADAKSGGGDAIAADNYLKAENATNNAILDHATTATAKAFAMSKSALATGTGTVTGYLFGREVTI